MKDDVAKVAVTLDSVFEQAAFNHETYSAQPTPEDDLRFFALGLCGEAGELANFVKKRIRDGDGHDEDLRLECADVFAYTIMMARSLGMTAQDLLDTVAHKQAVFVAKMSARAYLQEQP
jgi:NTP pyrophosphatase (non-canonical NTP hydrolase)